MGISQHTNATEDPFGAILGISHINYTLPRWIDPGEYYIFAVFDPFHVVAEDRENDNVTAPVRVVLSNGQARTVTATDDAVEVVEGGSVTFSTLTNDTSSVVETLQMSRIRDGVSVQTEGITFTTESGITVSAGRDGTVQISTSLLTTPLGAGEFLEESINYVVFGSADGSTDLGRINIRVRDPETPAILPVNYVGTPEGEEYDATGGNDTLAGGGGPDTLRGLGGNDLFHVPDTGFTLIDGGAGVDTLFLDGGGLVLNLGPQAVLPVLGMEQFNLSGSGNNRLVLSTATFAALAGGANAVKVDGNAGDELVLLEPGWTEFGTVEGYRFLGNGDASIILNQAVSIGTTSTLSTARLSASKPEGTGGTTAFTFMASRTGFTGGPAEATWTVTGGGVAGTVAATGADFVGGVLPTGKVQFLAGSASQIITVNVAADSAAELNESFKITLSEASQGTAITGGTATATILNDDTVISIAATSASKPEGSGAAPTPFVFMATRQGDTSKSLQVAWSVAGLKGNGTIPADFKDFAGGALPNGTVTFGPGSKAQTITVNVVADRFVEANERFAVTLSPPSGGAILGTASAGALIHNDDAAGTGTVSIGPATVARGEGQAGSSSFVFLATRSGNLAGGASLDWAVTGGSVAGTVPTTAADFVGGTMPGGPIVFAAGEATRTITVGVKGDAVVELNESFTVTLANASSGVGIGTASARGVVYNDDSAGSGTLTVSRLSAVKQEGNGGSTAMTFSVTRAGDASAAAGASWVVSGGGVAGAVTAQATDFAGGLFPAGWIGFTPNVTTRTVTVLVAGDTADELDEGFTVTLVAPQPGVSLGAAITTGVIVDEDSSYSTAANEELVGTAQDDIFVLGGGMDSVAGLGGADLFRFLPSALSNGSVVPVSFLLDFDPATDKKVDLSLIDAVAGTLPNEAFAFIGATPFSNAPSQLRWADTGEARLVQGDVNGDGVADLTLYLFTPGPVAADWFQL